MVARETAAETRETASSAVRRCWGEAPGHEIKREKKSSKDWRITPCSRRVFGFTPREAVAMITSCEGMAADPVESTDCPTFVRRRVCSAAAAAQRAAAAAAPEGLHHLAFHLSKRILHFGATATVKKKSVWGPPPSLARCIRPQPYGPCYPHDRLRPSGT